jgi:hypothetical protein
VPGATQTGWITPELEKIIYLMYLRGESDSLKILIDVITMLASKWRKSNSNELQCQGGRTSKLVEEALHRVNFLDAVPYAPKPLNVFLRNHEGEIRGGLIGIVQACWLHIGTLSIHVLYRRVPSPGVL